MMTLKKILDAIERKGIKQGKAEQEAGLARGRISKWKSNQGELGWEDVTRLARVLELPLDFLANDGQSEIVEPAKLNDDERIILTMVHDLGYVEARHRLLGIATPLIEAVETPKPAPPPVVAPREHDRRSATG